MPWWKNLIEFSDGSRHVQRNTNEKPAWKPGGKIHAILYNQLSLMVMIHVQHT